MVIGMLLDVFVVLSKFSGDLCRCVITLSVVLVVVLVGTWFCNKDGLLYVVFICVVGCKVCSETLCRKRLG